MKNRKLIFGLFLGAVILDLVGIITGNELMRYIFKPLIVLLLMTYYSVIIEPENKIYLAALFLCFLGDVLLLFNSQMNFMGGLIAFLLGHILYIKLACDGVSNTSVVQKITAFLPFGLVGFGLVYLLKDNLGDMLLPVIIYAIVISVFGVVSLLNYMKNKTLGSLSLLGGAIFFIISDATLAINKFYQSESYFQLFIMITYVLAQYLICRYMISRGVKE